MQLHIKVALCIPCYGYPEAKFTQSLANMISHFYLTKLVGPDGVEITKEVDTIIIGSSMLAEVRHRLAANALAGEADYLLWLDADHVFPPQTLNILLSRGKSIVGCNYPRRQIPTAPTAAKLESVGTGWENLVYTTQEKADAHELEEVAHLGFGVVLMHRSVFDAMQEHAEATGGSLMPLFQFNSSSEGKTLEGEDVYFFKKARAAGVKVYCDHHLSWKVGHCMSMILTNENAWQHRDQWANSGEKEQLDHFAKAIARLDAKRDAQIAELKAAAAE